MNTEETENPPTTGSVGLNIHQSSEATTMYLADTENTSRPSSESVHEPQTLEATSVNSASTEETQNRSSSGSVNKPETFGASTVKSTDTQNLPINKHDASKCSSTTGESDLKLTLSKNSPRTAERQKNSTQVCKSVTQKYKSIRTGKKGVSMPTLRMQKTQRTLKQRLQEFGKKHQCRPNIVSRRSRLETLDETEETRKLQLFSLAVDSICKCKGVVDAIMKERPGVSVECLRHFKYILFDKAIEFVEEFNTLMRILVKKELKVDVSSALPQRTRLLYPYMMNPLLDLI